MAAEDDGPRGSDIEQQGGPQPLAVVVLEDPITRAMQVDTRGLPFELAAEILMRAVRYLDRQQIVTDLADKLAGPRIVGANGHPPTGPGPVGHARRFTG